MVRVRPTTPHAPTGRSRTETGQTLLQSRLRLLVGLMLVITVAFYVANLVMVVAALEKPWPRHAHISYWLVVVFLGAVWLACRRWRVPAPVLRGLDVVMTVLVSNSMFLGPVDVIPEKILETMVILHAVMLTLYARAIFLPSSALRTFVVSTVAAAPLAAYALTTEPLRLAVWKLVWLAAAVTVATAGSKVIYGLRRDVQRARRLGQYTLDEKLGEGGMGEVYRASHALLRRPTAVKLLKPERIGEAELQRFEREVQLTASLSHPNTVSVYDFGLTSEGSFYYAMEYLDGLDLDRIVKGDGPQPPERVVHVMRQVLGALTEAHGIGLIHRDIKPGNVILCERGGVLDVAKVVDFGLVKDLEAADGTTRDGALMGTPLYLSPEAILSADVDQRSDLYSLAAVGYLLLTGQHVFDGQTVVEVCSHHLHTRPRPPSEKLGRPLPASLEAWLLRCLEKEPDKRPATAAEAAAALDADGLGQEWTAGRARAWWAGPGDELRREVEPGERTDRATLTLGRIQTT